MNTLGQMMLALETRWVRRRLAQGLQGGPTAPGQFPAGDFKLDRISPLFACKICARAGEGVT